MTLVHRPLPDRRPTTVSGSASWRIVSHSGANLGTDMRVFASQGPLTLKLVDLGEGRCLEAIGGYTVNCYNEGENWCHENQAIGLVASGHSVNDLVKDVESTIAILWTEIAEEPDDNLAPDAQTAKRELLRRFREVKVAPAR